VKIIIDSSSLIFFTYTKGTYFMTW